MDHSVFTSARPIFGLLIITAGLAVADDFKISRATIDGGGEMFSRGGEFELSGTIGQPNVGLMSGEDLELVAGFWFPLQPGDCNIDGTVDLIDFYTFSSCMSGPAEAHHPDCTCCDLDRDGDIDLQDVARFERSFDGG